MFEAYDKATGKALEKTNFGSFFEPGVTYRLKKLSSRVVITPVDDLMKPIFCDFLGIESNGSVEKVLKEAGVKDKLVDILKGGVSAIIKTKEVLEKYVETLYRQNVIGLVMYIGSTGLIPDNWDVKAETADQIQAALPKIKIGKDEQEGSFFRIADSVVSVYATNEYYSTGRNSANAAPQAAGTSAVPQNSPTMAPAF
jgi:hypothetical protein